MKCWSQMHWRLRLELFRSTNELRHWHWANTKRSWHRLCLSVCRSTCVRSQHTEILHCSSIMANLSFLIQLFDCALFSRLQNHSNMTDNPFIHLFNTSRKGTSKTRTIERACVRVVFFQRFDYTAKEVPCTSSKKWARARTKNNKNKTEIKEKCIL